MLFFPILNLDSLLTSRPAFVGASLQTGQLRSDWREDFTDMVPRRGRPRRLRRRTPSQGLQQAQTGAPSWPMSKSATIGRTGSAHGDLWFL